MFQRPLLLRKLHNLLIHKQPFALSDSVHIDLRNIHLVRFLSEVFQLLFSGGNPERVDVEELISARKGSIEMRFQRNPTEADLPAKNQLRAGSA